MVHQLENQWPVEHMSLQCTRRLMAPKSISPECKYPVYSTLDSEYMQLYDSVNRFTLVI